MTPDQVHYGQADAVHAARQKTLDLAYTANPERFVRKSSNPPNKRIHPVSTAAMIRQPGGSLPDVAGASSTAAIRSAG